MIHLLFLAIFLEMFIILLLLFKTPVRKLVTMGLDRVKRGKGPIVLSTVAGTVLIVFASTVYNIIDFMSREVEPGAMNPTDQVLMAGHVLDATLMGIMLFLGLIIDRSHNYINELRLLRKTIEAAKQQSRSFDDNKNGNSDELKALGEEIASLKTKIEILESESAAKAEEAKAAEAKADAMKKQSEGLLLEYDRLLEENQSLQNQLKAIDPSLSHTDGKKNL